ncbi:Uncharacterized protein PCOAH_00028290 [Plasmodium coatneyi]|uniref:SICA antigen n=1 Tax=Plasmodium coatneyi TaxID=208452 RepID=A0A1B1E128_9APIC|nr:Uncharacterized protein PCOAH_00028290 [Plasmodium coatneyi]ANQ08742.1 Uncharacterized protein PCOAH_00028290 [Plasmodium coatneyi]
MEEMFNELIERMSKDHQLVQTMCSELGEGYTVDVVNRKDLCKAMIKILFYINKLKMTDHGKLEVERGNNGEEGIWDYMRCIIGSVTIIQLFGKHCRLREITEYVSGAVGAQRDMLGAVDNYRKCKWVNTESFSVANRMFGKTVQEWIEKNESKKGIKGAKEIVRKAKCDKHVKVNIVEEKGESERKMGVVGVLRKTNDNELKKMVENEGGMEKDKVNQMLDGMKNLNCSQLEQKIKEQFRGAWELGEDDNINEWFTKFSNQPTDSESEYYDFKLFGYLSSVCDSDAQGQGRLKSVQDKEFCRVMVKNLMMANKNKRPCEEDKEQSNNCQWKCISKCDLLNAWLLYVGLRCNRMEVIKYAFEAFDALDIMLKNSGYNNECRYGKFSGLYRGKHDMVNLLSEFIRRNDKRNKLSEIHDKNWCKGGKTTNFDPLKVSLRGRGSGNQGGDERLGEFVEKVEKLKEEIQKIQQSPPSKPGGAVNTCSNGKSKLQTRLDKVTSTWKNNRPGTGMDKYWNNDIKSILKDLSNAMNSTGTADDNLCKDIGQKTNGTSTEEQNKKACTYIVRGLKHIYNIPTDLTDTNDRDNREFKSTIACALLNAYMKELLRGNCITKEAVEYAFTIKRRSYGKGCPEGVCKECHREECTDYTVEHENLWNKVKTTVDGKDGIVAQTITAINDICTQNTQAKTQQEPGSKSAPPPKKPGNKSVQCGKAATYRKSDDRSSILISGAEPNPENCNDFIPPSITNTEDEEHIQEILSSIPGVQVEDAPSGASDKDTKEVTAVTGTGTPGNNI